MTLRRRDYDLVSIRNREGKVIVTKVIRIRKLQVLTSKQGVNAEHRPAS